MFRRCFCLVFCLSVALGSLPAAEHAPLHKIKVVKAAPNPEENDLTTYYFALLTRGPRAGEGTREEREQVQAAHLANISRLAKEGKLLVAGPFADNGPWRGIFIYKCASLAEAQALAATDPAVKSGRLVIEIHPWMTAKGYIRDPEFPTPK